MAEERVMSGARGDSVSVGGVVRAEWEAAGGAIRCAAGVGVSGCETRKS